MTNWSARSSWRKALGTERICTSTTLTVARRLVPLMEKHRMEVAFHGHINTADPNEFAGPESFRKALAMSPFARINLDIGQFHRRGLRSGPVHRGTARQDSGATHPRRPYAGSAAKCRGARAMFRSKKCFSC